MASYKAIEATTRAVLELLRAACPKDEFSKALFEPYNTANFQNPMEEGVSLYLYRLGLSSRRNLPARRDAANNPLRPPIPVDLYYLLTAWAKTAEKQQRLLGFCLRELGDTPILPATFLNHFASEAVFQPDESVELVFDPLSLQDLGQVWDLVKTGIQTSVSYVARMVALESTIPVTQNPPVTMRRFDLKEAVRE
jgi:hypothetical protein